jgi:hypothetical protein
MSESVETAHGTVAYETATCVSCGEEFNKEDMADVVVGEIVGFNTFRTAPDDLKFADGYTTGRLCPYCQNDPASYVANPDIGSSAYNLQMLLAYIVLSMLVALLTVVIVF